MKQIKQLSLTLLLLITAVAGAWATTYTELKVGDVIKVGDKLAPTENWNVQIEGSGGGFLQANKTYTLKRGNIDGAFVESNDGVFHAFVNDNDGSDIGHFWTTTATSDGIVVKEYTDGKWVLGIHEPSADGPEVDINEAKTTATFEMPANDVTVNYTLVRDMQDATSPVAFSGIPTGDGLTVKKGSDGKYKFGTYPTFKLTDPLADNADIIAADGITVKVEKQGVGETWTAGTLTDFLTDAQPGTYRLKAMPTDENSPYDGTVTSGEFTLVEQYDLTLQPADDYSKGKLDEVTVDGTAATPDAEGKVKGIVPNTEVKLKLKAKSGYVIDRVEAWNSVLTYPIALSAVTADYVGSVVCSDGIVYPAKTAAPSGKTAVGILGKVTDTGHGLILALKNATNQNWNTINGWTGTTDFAGTTLKVLPDGARGANLTSYNTLGETAVSNWAVAQKSDYEAIFTNLGSTTGNTNGPTYDAKVNAYITGAGGTAISVRCWSATEKGDEDAWDFHNDYWRKFDKTVSRSIWPVLGF